MVVVRDDDDTIESQDERSEHRLRNQIAIFSEERDFGGTLTYWNNKDYSDKFWILFVVSFCSMVLFIAIFFIIFLSKGSD
jgi:hypothetical protein